MPKTLQIRDVDDETYSGLVRHAAEAGLSVPEFLRREITRVARRPSMTSWLERTRRRPSQIASTDVVDVLDHLRGDWPDADR